MLVFSLLLPYSAFVPSQHTTMFFITSLRCLVNEESGAKDLLAKLRKAHPGRFGEAQLRTLQRRVKDWRGVMAKKLVYDAPDEPVLEPSDRGGLVLAEAGIGG